MNKELCQNALARLTALLITDADGNIAEVNDYFCELSQYAPDELIGQNIRFISLDFSFIPSGASSPVWRGELKIKRKDESWGWLCTAVTALTDATGQVVGFLSSSLDISAQKAEEVQMLQQIQKNNFMIEHHADAYVSVDAGWLITTCNNKMAQILGMTPKESVDLYFLDLFLAGTNAHDKCENLKQALDNQEPATFDVFCPGRKVWFEVNVYPDGEGVSLSFRDITENKLADEKIKKSEQQLRAILQSTVSAFFFLDPDMRVISFNEWARQNVKRMFNQDLQEGDDIRMYSFDSNAQAITDSFQKALEGKPVEIERKIWVNGTVEWYWMTYFPVFGEDGEIIGVVLNAASINNLKFFESETLRMNERFQLAAKATNDALYDWNIEQNMVHWYEAFYKMFGYSLHEVESTLDWWADRIHPEEKELVVNSLNQALGDKQINWSAEYRFLCRNNTYKYVFERAYIVYSETGVPIRMIGALQDIQRGKEHELKIKQQNEQLREIAFSQSHEVRRPVANILGLLKCLNKDDFGPQNQQVLHFLEQTAGELDVVIRKIVTKTYYT
ncbi:PAS domain-containing protein [Adhaeribacter swui]|uniref:histidine kinase n=1 Tax=Adhaeribacter swui TaxID=2086471 RepID=A0A7G7G479_9BACT|nr:PAS domain-containing protein [Adhaeribacter swui]QNF31963.1 PAS domain-containing protein [Adhaeribacter swui]